MYADETQYADSLLDDLVTLTPVKSTQQAKLLLALAKRSSYDGGIILNPAVRSKIAEELGSTSAVFRNTMGKLRDQEILKRCGYNEYRLHGDYLFIQDIAKSVARAEDFTLSITYSESGTRKVQVIAG